MLFYCLMCRKIKENKKTKSWKDKRRKNNSFIKRFKEQDAKGMFGIFPAMSWQS